ncbi:RtcB Uncharacterized conserved protein [uncultured Caudovirales phage]|uniref:3'-phosphate/5'-hydroxy nucleic acid ligase n=1 Tax=uncultured Caudovirales phage TaxID=2100421 RepID=A0A6J5LU77_9CAUD|nr:RtcB Uncharacterized conserved protein [uncultured Caudovirales phage]CAB4135249.1 RtcB Uncharacterized conserved protein [uncultured Caudovirales phage]
MLEYEGKYAKCKVMTDNIEETAVTQIYGFLNSPAFEGATIRIMPDVHAGAGAVVGFTSTLTDKVIPNVIGVDIGCAIESYRLGKEVVTDFLALDNFIRAKIPSGFNVHEKVVPHRYDGLAQLEEIAERTEQDYGRVLRSLGTLGGGNHFIELGVDQFDDKWLTIHTGSRNFGLKVATYHQHIAEKAVGKRNGLAWLEGATAKQYLADMLVAQEYAARNRAYIADRILQGFFGKSIGYVTRVGSVHNYIDFMDNVIRKGAISAREHQLVVIPWNMRDGLIIGRGKGNKDWNTSAPHGAGRVMGRGVAKKTIQLEDFQESMKGIWSSCISKDTLDESPMVYKDAETIKAEIGDAVEITNVVKPLYNFKAS